MAKSDKSSDARRRIAVLGACCLVWLGMVRAESAGADDRANPTSASSLDRGFSRLYNLDFEGAQQDFAAWERQYPDNPMGPVSEAAACLFSEFDRLGVLESQFYENDKAFARRPKVAPDPVVRERFQRAIGRARSLASARLTKDANDRDSLFAMTLSAGLEADYAALIAKRNLASLHFTKEAYAWAQQLLAVCNNCYDALLATGFSKYIMGSMAPPIRWLLRLSGLPADKNGGIDDLKVTAQRGHYLAPFARILLAIAYVREKNNARALELLAGLRREFPGNPLFPREIARLQAPN